LVLDRFGNAPQQAKQQGYRMGGDGRPQYALSVHEDDPWRHAQALEDVGARARRMDPFEGVRAAFSPGMIAS
jgi:hypothetical protein